MQGGSCCEENIIFYAIGSDHVCHIGGAGDFRHLCQQR